MLNHFISLGLWDEARIFYGDQIYKDGVKAPEIDGKLFLKTKFSKSTLEILMNRFYLIIADCGFKIADLSLIY